jgi:hypothetical protein
VQAPVRLYYRSLLNHHEPYLTAEDEDKLGITIVPLDLRSGDAPDGGPRFIKPAQTAKMEAFVERNEPWEEYPLDRISKDDEEHPDNMKGKSWAESVKFDEGRFMLGSLQEYCHTPFMNGDYQWFNQDWCPDVQ